MSGVTFTRNRPLCFFCLIAVIAIGLASRRYTFLFPSFLGKYPGDALWAIMVYLCWCLSIPSVSVRNIATYALATSYLDEFSQLYQAPWMDIIRKTTVGHLIFGSTFSWLDILAYTIGIIVVACIETLILALTAHTKEYRVLSRKIKS